MFAQFGDISKRSAAKEDLRMHFCSACQRTHHLHRNGMEHRGGNVLFAYRTGNKVLDVGLAEHAATGRNRVDMLGFGCQRIQFACLHAQQRGCLVDKRTCSSCAVAVHAHLRHATLLKEDHLAVLTADIHQTMYIGIELFYYFCCSNHLLVKTDTKPLCTTHSHRTGDADSETASLKVERPFTLFTQSRKNTFDHLLSDFHRLCVMAPVVGCKNHRL